MIRNDRLIFDIGTSEGNDTAFYLRKGFDVISVEADPVTFAAVSGRFAAEVASGRLQVLNRAAARLGDQALTFWRNDQDQGLSSLTKSRKLRYDGKQSGYEVTTVGWADLVGRKGVPYYAKIDIEGAETDFLSGIEGPAAAPRYLSAEAKSPAVLGELRRIGYRKFRIVDQKAIRGFKVPKPALEGEYVDSNNSQHGSGLFGRELPGRTWLDFETAQTCLESLLLLVREGTIGATWFDCHCHLDA